MNNDRKIGVVAVKIGLVFLLFSLMFQDYLVVTDPEYAKISAHVFNSPISDLLNYGFSFLEPHLRIVGALCIQSLFVLSLWKALEKARRSDEAACVCRCASEK